MRNPAGSRACSALPISAAAPIPDVSLIATLWLMCSYDTTPCNPTNAPSFHRTGTIKVLEGTSAAAPSMAAIVALIDQSQISSSVPDGRQGLMNPTLYSLAAIEYGSATTAAALCLARRHHESRLRFLRCHRGFERAALQESTVHQLPTREPPRHLWQRER